MQIYRSLIEDSINSGWTGVHLTDHESAMKIKETGKFNTPEVWLAPDDTSAYGGYAIVVSAPTEKNPFVMDKYYDGDHDIERNVEYYEGLGGEANSNTFDKLRSDGYDVVIEDNGDRAYLYPDTLTVGEVYVVDDEG